MEGIFLPHLICTIATSVPILSTEFHNMVIFLDFLSSWSFNLDSHKWLFHRGHLLFWAYLAAASTPPCTGDSQGARTVLQGERQVLGVTCRQESNHSHIYIKKGALFSNAACCAGCRHLRKPCMSQPADTWSSDPSPAAEGTVCLTHMYQGCGQPQQHHSTLQASGLKGTQHQERKLQ